MVSLPVKAQCTETLGSSGTGWITLLPLASSQILSSGRCKHHFIPASICCHARKRLDCALFARRFRRCLYGLEKIERAVSSGESPLVRISGCSIQTKCDTVPAAAKDALQRRIGHLLACIALFAATEAFCAPGIMLSPRFAERNMMVHLPAVDGSIRRMTFAFHPRLPHQIARKSRARADLYEKAPAMELNPGTTAYADSLGNSHWKT